MLIRQEYLSTPQKYTKIPPPKRKGGKQVKEWFNSSPCLLMVTYSIIPRHYDALRSANYFLKSIGIIHLMHIRFGLSAFLSEYLRILWLFLRLEPETGCLLACTHTSFVSSSNSWNWKEEVDCTVQASFGGTPLEETQPERFWGYCSASRSFLSGLYIQTAPTWQFRQHNELRLVRRVLKANTTKFSLQAI